MAKKKDKIDLTNEAEQSASFDEALDLNTNQQPDEDLGLNEPLPEVDLERFNDEEVIDPAEGEELFEADDAEFKASPPKKVLVLQTNVLSMSMPGQPHAVVTRTFKEGQIVHDPEAIALLVAHETPIQALD